FRQCSSRLRCGAHHVAVQWPAQAGGPLRGSSSDRGRVVQRQPDGPVPLRTIEEEAVLRRHASGGGVRCLSLRPNLRRKGAETQRNARSTELSLRRVPRITPSANCYVF